MLILVLFRLSPEGLGKGPAGLELQRMKPSIKAKIYNSEVGQTNVNNYRVTSQSILTFFKSMKENSFVQNVDTNCLVIINIVNYGTLLIPNCYRNKHAKFEIYTTLLTLVKKLCLQKIFQHDVFFIPEFYLF